MFTYKRHLHRFTQAHKAKHSTELFTVLHKHNAKQYRMKFYSFVGYRGWGGLVQ